jgi:putative hydrolase of the HAD superfamily
MKGPARRSQKAWGVVFDGDDTLWMTEPLYDAARLEARGIVAGAGLDGATWEERERVIDVENVARFGFNMERFPTSCVEAYEELCRKTGRAVDPVTAERVRQAARLVFEGDPPLAAEARETLLVLRAKGARLALLTKGDRDLQESRIARSGLRDLFHVIRIVFEKSPADILEAVAALRIDVSSAWMVGNSVRSDVLPAIEAGLRVVWIPAHVWEHERALDHMAPESVVTATRLADIPALIEI